MKQKKDLLFVIESLTLAGSEKSLIALLSNLDSDLYNVDLQLFKYGEELEKFIPNFVNILSPLDYPLFVQKSIPDNIRSKNFKFLLAKLKYSAGLRTRKRNHSEIAKLYWESVKDVFKIGKKKYDVAIAFAQGVPTFYVIDKVMAKKKITWVNANVQFTKYNKRFQENYYNQYDVIVAISEGTKKHLGSIFPHLANKYCVIPNIIDYETISKHANSYQSAMKTSVYNILTVGRLDDGMKGMDITIETCKLLKEKNIKFHWYIIGEGSFRNSMQEFIKKHQLHKQLSLIGSMDNPYPYFKAADLYVQTSRHEGYGRTIAEARMLNLPIVTTNYDTVGLQINHLKNGIITNMDPESVANGIVKIMNDQELYDSIVTNLEQEPKENTETLKYFNQLMEE